MNFFEASNFSITDTQTSLGPFSHVRDIFACFSALKGAFLKADNLHHSGVIAFNALQVVENHLLSVLKFAAGSGFAIDDTRNRVRMLITILFLGHIVGA